MKLIQKIKVNIQSVLAQIHTWYKVNTTTLPTSINDGIYTRGNVGIGYNRPETNLHIMDSSNAKLTIQTLKDGSRAHLLFKCEDNATGAHRMARAGLIFESSSNIWGNGNLHICNYAFNNWGQYLNPTHSVITVHGNKLITFPGYPNTKNDADFPVNMLYTNPSGTLRSKNLKEIFAAFLPKTFVELDNSSRIFTTTWTTGQTWQTRTVRDGFNLKIHFEIPARNDSNSWGGGYLEVQYSINGGPFVSLGNAGYQLAMGFSARIIATHSRTVFLTRSELEAPEAGDFDIQFRFRYRSYDGLLYINLNRGTGEERFATLFELSEQNFNQ